MAIDRDKVLQAAQKFVEKKKYDKAVIEYQKLIQADPTDARTLLKIGDLQSKMGAHEAAISTYETVGKLYAAQGFALKAIAVYKQITEIIAKHVPKLEDRYSHITPKLADLYQQLGLTSDALATLDEVATRLQKQGKEVEANRVLRKIVELDGGNPLPHLRLAEALSRAQDIDGAFAEFQVAAEQLSQLGRRDDALKVLERLLHHKADPTQARIAAELYLERNQQNDGMQALAKLQICFQANPRDLDTLGLLSRAFSAIGQAAKGIEVQKEMARVARDSGRVELFQELCEKLSKLAPNDDGVKKLLAQALPSSEARMPAAQKAAEPPPPPPRKPPPPPARAAAVEEPEEEVEELDDDALLEDENEEMTTAAGGTDAYESESRLPAQTGPTQVASDPPAGPLDHRPLLSDIEVWRAHGQTDKAVRALRIGIQSDPTSFELREVLRDVLLEAERVTEAVEEMLAIAELYVDALDGDSAARTLQDVLAFDRSNKRALEMLSELGYEVVDENEGQEAAALDDPFGGEAPLPSYDLDEPEPLSLRGSNSPSRPAIRRSSMPPALTDEAAYEAEEAPPTILRTSDAPATAEASPPMELEDALEESEFFASRGLYEDARNILNEQLTRHPKHPLLRERLEELADQEALHNEQVARTKPTPEERALEISSSLETLSASDAWAQTDGQKFTSPDQEVDVEEVFAKFKEGVAAQISVDDSQAHYDLGVAYKEMMLVDDAIREFETAARDPNRECISFSMIGMIHLERGDADNAIAAFTRALDAPLKDPEQEAALGYELGGVYEGMHMRREALIAYQRTSSINPNYRDVAQKIRALSKGESKIPQKSGDDEFDRAFDDLLSGGGKN